jgi:hypothetical protein
MAGQCWAFVLVVLVLLFYATKGDNTNGNIIAARVEVSVVLIYFGQRLNINIYSYLFWKFVGRDIKQMQYMFIDYIFTSILVVFHNYNVALYAKYTSVTCSTF